MAIPNNYIDKITNKDTGESRIISPAADKVRVENENFEGADLDEVLDEVAQAIEDAGSGDGTVTGVKMNNDQPIAPDENGVVDLGTVITDVSNKVDKVTGYGLSKNDYTDADKTKLAGIETGAEKNVINGIKANGASETLPVENGIVTLPPAASPISPATAAPLEDGTAGVGSSAKYAREDHVHPHDTSKQDTLTFDDVPTAGHTTQVMSSDKIKTALDNLLTNLRIVNNEWYIGNTATGVSAQGPQGNCNITDASQLVTILVNDLTTGGAGNILSAEMGKVLKEAVSTLLDSMAEYCFPNGRPTLSWEGAKADIITNFNNSHVTSTNTAQRVDIGAQFETTLGTDNNLYVIDDDTVVVTMGGVTQVGAYSAVTGKVTIGEVTDTVEITANAITYIGYGETNGSLVAMWDGKNVDSANNQWVDVVGQRTLSLEGGCTVQSDHVEFDGSDDIAINTDTSVYVDVKPTEGTIECATIRPTLSQNGLSFVLINPKKTYPLMILSLMGGTNGTNTRIAIGQTWTGAASAPNAWYFAAGPTTLHLSVSNSLAYLNGTQITTRENKPFGAAASEYSRLVMSGVKASDGLTTLYSQSSVYCVRVYNTQLDANQVAHNYKVDRKRFNLSIS